MSHTQHSHLLNQLAEMPVFLRNSFAGMSSELLARMPTHDNAPLVEHLWHLRDCESDLYGPRIERVLSEARPHIVPMDVSGWPLERGYHARNGDQAIEEFVALRERLIGLLRTAAQPDFERVGIRADGSEIDVYQLAEQLADHDRDHRWRMCAILREYLER
ncbi:DinB family protein [Paraburkholderia sp. BCC1885]|uniref:DinB family protein n=1 Tax=Paraburkholderia sp. BCC1885 TaxID=2562669 RepID=UPI0011832755|nr:DinB family protein [Paraburkholderia sp. BCC1885]